MPTSPPQGIPRREFVKSAVAIGGASALSACLEQEVGASTPEEPEFPRGPSDPSLLPERQYAWNQYVVTDPSGDTILPQHQVLLFLEYTGSVPPSDEDRETVENALREIELAFQRGTGGNASATFNRGLLFTLGYSPRYFDRFETELPGRIDLKTPEAVLDALDEPTDRADSFDALLMLTSDFGSITLTAEEALFGEEPTVNGREMESTLDSVFELKERRTGFVGAGRPREEFEHDGIHENAPMSMGYKSGFQDANPPEDRVTIDDGPFTDGTTQLVSRLRIDLDAWYELDEDHRRMQMFTPHHSHERVGDTGEGLGGHSRVTEEMVDSLEDDAEEHDLVGHSQKTARARDGDFEQRILRRSEGLSTDVSDGAGMNFSSVQEGLEDFLEVRRAMNDLGGDVDPHHSGIIDFLEVERRATFLIPPRSLRALPSPRPDRE